MKLKDLLNRLEVIGVQADLDMEITGVSCNTVLLERGNVFVAVKGFEHDGHDFLAQAVAKGAVCVVTERTPEDMQTPYVLVPDTRKALAIISANWFSRPATKLKVVGVTGTNGKTTVSNLIYELIRRSTGKRVGLIGTNRNLIDGEELPSVLTTPGAYELHELLAKMVSAGCEYAVMEVSSHALALSRVYGIEFEIGVFTNLTSDHLDFHKTSEEYAGAKAQLFKMSRHGIVNLDDEYANRMISDATCPIYTYSTKDDTADLVAKSIRLRSDRVDFCALTIGQLDRVALNTPGMFSVYNSLAALAVGNLLGFSTEQSALVLKDCVGVSGRAEIVPADCEFTVMIDYAHTADALENIIKTVKEFAQGRVITVFGCGGDRDRTKRPLMGKAASELSDLAIITSDNPRTEEPGAIIKDIMSGVTNGAGNVRVIENRREAIHYALKKARKDDIVILAGKGHEKYQVIGKDKTCFDEREVVAEFFKQGLK